MLNSVGNFTVHDDQHIDEAIRQDLSLIVRRVLDLMGDQVVAVVLFGGFGRGEGGVHVDGLDVHPVNDYDIVIVTREPSFLARRKYGSRLHRLAKDLARQIGIKQVDLGLTDKRSLASAPLTIASYELRAGSKVIYGTLDLPNIMPDFDPTLIPLVEGAKLLFHRGGGLLIATFYLDENGEVAKENREKFFIECQKALLAMGDCALLLRGRYVCSYVERGQLIENVDIDFPQFDLVLSRYKEAIEFKVKPDFDRLPTGNLALYFQEIVDLYEKFYKYFEEIRLATQFQTWMDYSYLRLDREICGLVRKAKNLVRNAQKYGLSSLFFPGPFVDPEARLMASLPLLLFQRNDVSPQLLDRVDQLLGDNSRSLAEQERWQYLCKKLIRLWHP